MSDDKTEDASQQKLDKARDKGQVAKSQDLVIAFSMGGAILTMGAMSQTILERMKRMVGLALDFGDGSLPLFELYRRTTEFMFDALAIIGPIAAAAAACAVFGLLSHVGIKIAMEAVSPKFDAVDPAAGLKKIFSMKSVLTFIQTVFKAVVIGVAIWQVVVGLLPLIAGSAYQSVEGIGEIGWSAVMKIMNLGLLLFIVIGPIDFGLQKWLFLKDQRMSKDEVKREYKDAEGDPMMKGQRKQLAYEIANGDPAQAVGSANAVVVNPTHYAVAIRYVPGETALPVIVAKGIDEQALSIRRHAETQGVPIFANPPLARALHKVPIDNTVPEELFEPVAAILRWVDEIGSRQRLH